MSIFSDITSSLFGGGGGGGGGGAQQTTSTAYNTNIPEYAKPYVETMLGATQKQLFNGETDDQGNFNITGFKPYQAYGGTYDENGKQLSYDPSKAVAGFSPLQQTAQQGIAGLQVPGQYGQAQGITNMGIMGAMGTAGQANNFYGMGNQANALGQSANPYNFQNQVGGYMNPYMQQVLAPQMDELRRQYDITGQQQNAQAVGAGAFGGSRQAIQQSENQRNLGSAQNQAIGQAYNNAFNAAQNQYNQGNAFQMQGLQNAAAMYGQGIGAQQAAYNQAMQGGNQLAGLGQQELAAQEGIYGLQNQTGAQQQALQQQIINQSMTDYANAQQYPLMQLGTMSNMLRGLPMQAQTTNQYAAAPNGLTQAIGAAGTAASLYNATKAEGGVIKSMASGGITSYNVGGAIEADLEDMDVAGLQREIKESSSPRVKQMAQRILAEKQMALPTVRAAGGGIIAFAKPTEENNQSLVEDKDYPDTDVRFSDTTPKTTTPLTRAGQALRDAFSVKTPSKMRFEELDSELIPKKEETAAAAGKGITSVPVAKERVVPAATPAAKAEYKQPGILGAASAGTLGDNPKVNPNDWFSKTTEERDRWAKEASQDRGTLAKKLEDEAGPNVGRENYRAEQMAARANLGDEAKRQQQMRLAEFFASWGSTPGSTLIAGMTALKKTIPGMMEDTKEAKKLQREADKIIYDIDEATRLDKAGYRKEADTKIQNAAQNAYHLNSVLGTYAGHKLTADASMANASAQRAATAAGKEAANEERKISSLIHAQSNITNLLKEHDVERKNSGYANSLNLVKMGKDENGIDKPLSKLSTDLRGPVSEARRIVSETDARHQQELRDARTQERALRDRTQLGKKTSEPEPDRSNMAPIESFYKKP